MTGSDVHAVARLVVDMLKAEGLVATVRPTGGTQLADAAAVAAAIGVRREWVYAHAAQLGGRRIGDGPRPRWRFDLDQARAAYADLTEQSPPPAMGPAIATRPRRRRATVAGEDLLPIRPAKPRSCRA